MKMNDTYALLFLIRSYRREEDVSEEKRVLSRRRKEEKGKTEECLFHNWDDTKLFLLHPTPRGLSLFRRKEAGNLGRRPTYPIQVLRERHDGITSIKLKPWTLSLPSSRFCALLLLLVFWRSHGRPFRFFFFVFVLTFAFPTFPKISISAEIRERHFRLCRANAIRPNDAVLL